jgi:hypothetical protein
MISWDSFVLESAIAVGEGNTQANRHFANISDFEEK